ncbi:MAG: GntR family transcriptional regulator [Clostridia bacterium]|nr:GntR family transcriptional regulator [Clostridia bacterium]
MISLDYKDGRSLHEQIESGLKELMVSGILASDEQLPSVRELAVSLTVNPNTVQRAYKQLEADGFIYSVKGKGSFVASVASARDAAHTEELYASLTSIVKELMYLGEEKTTVENIITNVFSEKEGM